MLKSLVWDDKDFAYLKWLLNKINFIQKLKVVLKNDASNGGRCKSFESLPVDASCIREYCLPHSVPNLVDFQFYIGFKRSLSKFSMNEIELIQDSFKTHRFFVERQWIHVKCLFDPIRYCQYIYSSFNNNNDIISNDCMLVTHYSQEDFENC